MTFRSTDPDDMVRRLGRRVAELRALHGLTQVDLAGRAGVSDRYLQRVERGTENLTVRTLVKLANAFDVPFVALFEVPTMPRVGPGRPRRERAKIAETLELEVADVLAIAGSPPLTELLQLTRMMTPTQMRRLVRQAARIAASALPGP
jgi:transcriptional regulator with XRE-family HTH domain